MTVLTSLGPVDTVESHLDEPPSHTPRLLLVAHGGRASRKEALDTPTDPAGVVRLVDWLHEHEGWAVVGAQLTPAEATT